MRHIHNIMYTTSLTLQTKRMMFKWLILRLILLPLQVRDNNAQTTSPAQCCWNGQHQGKCLLTLTSPSMHTTITDFLNYTAQLTSNDGTASTASSYTYETSTAMKEQNMVASCNCSLSGLELFSGELCQNMIMDFVNLTVTPRTVNITWPIPPRVDVDRYQFVYRKNLSTGTLDDEEFRAPFKMLDEKTARLENLDSGEVRYVICVLPNDSDWPKDVNDECVSVTTQTNDMQAYTIAAIVVGSIVAVAIIILVLLKLIFYCRGLKSEKQDASALVDDASVHTIDAEIPAKTKQSSRGFAAKGIVNHGADMDNTYPARHATQSTYVTTTGPINGDMHEASSGQSIPQILVTPEDGQVMEPEADYD